MDLLASDTSVLDDLKRGSLLEAAFGLPYRFVVPDLQYEREMKDHGGDELIALGLVVCDLTGEQVELARSYRRERPALSWPDVFALTLAIEEDATLLTGDKRLRALASKEGIVCHGLLWLLDEMHLNGIPANRLTSGLQVIRAHPRCRLPQREVNERLAKYAHTDSVSDAGQA